MSRHIPRVVTLVIALLLGGLAYSTQPTSAADSARTQARAGDITAYVLLPNRAAPPCVRPVGEGQYSCVIVGRKRGNEVSFVIVRLEEENIVVQNAIPRSEAKKMVKRWKADCGRRCDPFAGGEY